MCVSVLFTKRAATAMNCTGGSTLRIACVLFFSKNGIMVVCHCFGPHTFKFQINRRVHNNQGPKFF